MPIRPEDVPSDPARLAAMVLALDAENERLRAIVRTLKDLLFGARSERAAVIDVAQLPLDLDDLAVGPTPPPPPANDEGGTERKADRPRRPAVRNIGALPKHLPRCEEVIEPETTVCPCCSGALHRIGEETREALDVVPAFVRVKRTIFPKYACRTCEGAIVQAKSPPRLVEGGMATTALVTHVAVSKFAWHIPLYRQAQIFNGQGMRLDRSTLALWMKRAAWWLKPLYERQLAAILSGSHVFSDETPMPVLDPGRGRTKCGQFWSHAVDDRPWGGPAPPAVAYVYAEGRSMADLASQVQGFTGILQSLPSGLTRGWTAMAATRGWPAVIPRSNSRSVWPMPVASLLLSTRPPTLHSRTTSSPAWARFMRSRRGSGGTAPLSGVPSGRPRRSRSWRL